jgi:hypothetical protein
MATKQEIVEVLAMLAAVYPRHDMPKEAVGAYALLLQDLDGEELRASARDIATKSKWFPSVHELRANVAKLRARAVGIPTAYEAWAEVINTGPEIQLSTVETDQGDWTIKRTPYQWSHPIVEQVARLMGWPSKFPSGQDTLMADRAHFFKAYDRAIQDAMDDEITLPEIQDYIESKRSELMLEAGDD